MVAQPRFGSEIHEGGTTRVFVPAPSVRHLEPAGATHSSIDSPAIALQARLDAAIANGAWTDHDVARTDRLPGSVRVAFLIGSAGASWVLIWQAARLLIAAI